MNEQVVSHYRIRVAISPIGGWKWTASGVNVQTGAHVNVSGTVPKAKAS